MTKVLLTGISSNVAQGISLGLREYKGDLTIIGTDIAKLCAGYFLVDKGIQIPRFDSEGYVEHFIKLLKKEKINYVFPGVDPELPLLANNKKHIEDESGAEIIISDRNFIEQTCDKYKTPTMLKKMGLHYPETSLLTEEKKKNIEKYPIIVKPRLGAAARGQIIIKSRSDVNKLSFIKNPLDYCVQEYLDGEEYTCGLLFDKDGKLRDTIIMERELDYITGTTVMAHVVNPPEIKKFLEEFGTRVKGAFGSINLQLRYKKGGYPTIFEINPRFSGTTAFRVLIGFNDPLRLFLNVIEDKPITPVKLEERYYFRYLTQIEVDPKKVNNTLREAFF